MVKDFFRGFGYTIGKIIAFLFIGLLSAFLLSKVDPSKIPFKQLVMKTLFVNAHALSSDSRATIGRENFMDTGSTYFNTGWVSLNSNSMNWKQMSSNGSFYMMGSEYAMALTWTGDSSCTGSVEIPVVAGDFNNFKKMDTLGISDFKLGIDKGFGVYNLSPNVKSFSHFCNDVVGDFNGYRRLYCDYTLNFTIDNLNIPNGATNLNFAMYNTSASHSAYFINFAAASNFNAYFPSLYSNNATYPNMSPKVTLNCSSSSSSVDTTIIENNQQTIINQNDTIINNQTDINNSINDINDTLQDTTISGDSIGSKFADIYLISDTPITDLLTMPLHLLQKIYNSLQNECSAYVLPFDFGFSSIQGYTITLPCLNLGHENRLGRVVWGYIDDLCCIFMIYNIFKMVIYFYDSWTSLKDNFDWLIDPSTRGLPY